MRFLDAMTPARSWEEAAMMPARMRTMSDGAALKSVKTITKEMETMAVAEQKNPAAEEESTWIRRRAALRHVLERQF